jgi:hypothetical protein
LAEKIRGNFDALYEGRRAMREARPHSIAAVGLLLLAASAFFPPGAAFAGVAVTQYVVLNPIDVCAAGGTGCAPFNTLKTTPGAATVLTPIGFVDSTTNINVTRADWLQAGIDVTFLPIKQYTSPANIDPWRASDTSPPNTPYTQTDYRTLHVVSVTCAGPPVATNLTSPDFQTVTMMSVCGAPSTANPPPLPSPAPPLHTDSKVIDVFFVNDILEAGARLAGFSWINRNGIAVAKDAFSTLAPRFDTLSHEIGHALNLDHTTFQDTVTGPGFPCTTGVPSPGGCNLLDAGSNGSNPFRIVPSSAGCSTGGALYDLDTGLCSAMPSVPQADQLNIPQENEALISGFMNPTKNVNATAGGGAPAGAAATTTAASAASASTGSSIPFSVTDDPGFGRFNRSTGDDTETIMAIALAFPKGISPKATNPITVTGTGGPTVARVRTFTPGSGDDNEQGDEEEGDGGIITNKTFQACHSGITCLEIDFKRGTFIDNTFNFTVNFKTNVTTGQLAGTRFTVVTDDLFATTSTFEPCGECFPPLATNSQFPDATIAAIIVNPARFAAFGAPPSFTGFGLQACTVPIDTTAATIGGGGDSACPQPTLPQGE